MNRQQDRLVDRNCQGTDHNVISRRDIIRGIQSKIIPGPIADFIRMNRAKLAVRTRIPKIKSKLLSLNVNVHCIRRSRFQIYRCPGLLPNERKGEYLNAH